MLKNKTSLKGFAVFVAVSLFFVAGVSAINGAVSVTTSDEGVEIIESAGAEGGEYISFQGSGSQATGQTVARSSFPVRNTAFDNVQFQNLAASEVPTENGANPAIGGPGDWGVSFLDNEWGPGGSDANIETGSAFRTWCSFSHFGYNDPVVFPGMENVAHLHMFFGNTLTDHNSTGESLLDEGGSTCDGGVLNRTSYWIPAMLDGVGNAVVPHWMFLYYKTFKLRAVEPSPAVTDAEVFPEGLQILSTVVSTDGQPTTNIDFWCGDVHGNVRHNTHREFIPDCSGLITQRVRFPYCWDGRLESEDFSHMVYPIGDYGSGLCPDTHQRRIPHIEYQLTYSVPPGTNTSNWHLSSDVNPSTGAIAEGGTTSHGDWFNGWNPTINEQWNENCTRTLWDCAQGGLERDKTRLNFHNRNFQNVSPNQYLIPVSELTQLCPGDVDNNTVDIAYCSDALAASPDALATHIQHHHGGDTGNVAGDQDVQPTHDNTHATGHEISQ